MLTKAKSTCWRQQEKIKRLVKRIGFYFYVEGQKVMDEKGRDVIRKFLLEIAEFERNERKKKASEMTIKIGREVNMIRLH